MIAPAEIDWKEAATAGVLVEELLPVPDSLQVFERLAHLPHAVFFDSAMREGDLGRYSYIAADPFDWLVVPADETDGLQALQSAIEKYKAPTIANLPPWQGGAAGVLGYELGRSLEQVPAAQHDEFQLPALAMGLYDVVIAFDHQHDRAWILSHGFPETTDAARQQRAEERLQQFRQLIESPAKSVDYQPSTPNDITAPQFPVEDFPGVTSDFARDDYLAAVQRAVDYIHAGDIFQVNLSQRLLRRQTGSPLELYCQLRTNNPATFAGYLDAGDWQLCSASPERFVSVDHTGHVETRPIKGTRPRSAHFALDWQLGEGLLAHPKDRAENVMIVDLLRNDLSRVCKPPSVKVTQLCALESYKHVHHLVSVVVGQLEDHQTAIDLLRASFPGGSITGAPKIRAMEIIAELEPTARGPYCGSLAFVGFDGTFDSSILIRTAVVAGGWVQTSVGGGIVADSDPAGEYAETLQKAVGLL